MRRLVLQAVLGRETSRRVSQWLPGAVAAKLTGFTFNSEADNDVSENEQGSVGVEQQPTEQQQQREQ